MSHPFGTFVREHNLGRVYVELGYQLFSDPDTVRGPDVSFVSRKRQRTAKTPPRVHPRRPGPGHRDRLGRQADDAARRQGC